MECNINVILKMKVNARVNNVFAGIIDDLPKTDNSLKNVSGKNYLSTTKKGQIINYESFYREIYNCILEYMPRDNENPFLKALKKLPQAIKNVKRISENKEILEFQNEILKKYFYEHGDENIRDKINELKEYINISINDGDLEYISRILDHFEDRMQNGIVKDMQQLSILLKKRG